MTYRYWAANLVHAVKPNMGRHERQKLIHLKYVIKAYVPKISNWEMKMQTTHPLNKDELAVLKFVDEENDRKHGRKHALNVPSEETVSDLRSFTLAEKLSAVQKCHSRYTHHPSEPQQSVRWTPPRCPGCMVKNGQHAKSQRNISGSDYWR
jgi:hypothetical protein